MTPLKTSQLRALLAKAIPAHEPVLISGAPGVGKTDVIRNACVEAGADLLVMHPVVSDPTDFKGLPWVVDGSATFLPFGDLQRLIVANSLTVCFLDDLGQATPAVQSAAMQLLLARHINGHAVSQHVVFLAATNRRTDRANVQGILEPVKSRFITSVELKADLDDWRAWAIGAGIRPEVYAFLSMRPELLSAFTPTADLTNSPSPRTWHAVSRLLNLGLPDDILLSSIEGAVGQGAATEFVGFLRIASKLVSPDVILSAPDSAPIPRDEPSALYAIATGVAARVTAATMPGFARYLNRLGKEGLVEFAALAWNNARTRDPKLQNTAGYAQLMSGALGQVHLGGEVA